MHSPSDKGASIRTRGDRIFKGKNCTTQAQCNAPDFKTQIRQSFASLASFTGIVKYYSCCQTKYCNNGGKTFQFRGCGVKAACETSDYKTEIKQYITGIASSFTGTVNDYSCCQTDLCNGGGQQLIGRGCATTAQCAAADFKEQLKQYIGSLVPSFTGTVDSYTCCQQNLCNNGGGSGGGGTTKGGSTTKGSGTTSSTTKGGGTTSSTTKGGSTTKVDPPISRFMAWGTSGLWKSCTTESAVHNKGTISTTSARTRATPESIVTWP
ncbi:unnamed protein product [Lampetra fluviatilis]